MGAVFASPTLRILTPPQPVACFGRDQAPDEAHFAATALASRSLALLNL